MSNYGYTRKMDCGFETATERVKASLVDQGFGILTEIDVKATMKKKLNRDIEDYVILGACNPQLAAQALENEKEIGLLLPCNVVAYKSENEIFISAMMPSVAMSFVENEGLASVAEQAETKLKTAIDNA